jgi:tetratricopeptide (TPR) repeat protein
MEAVFIRLGEAYEVLRNPKSRSTYESDLAARAPRTIPTPVPTEGATPADPEKEAKLAEEAIRRADKKFQEESYWDAIQILEPSVSKAQGKMRHKGRVLLARCYLKNPNWVKRGEELLHEVIRDDPKNLDAHWLLANIYKAGGLKSRARHMFERILEFRPDHEEAAAEAAKLIPEEPEEPEAPSGGGGLFKKLFGKS